MYLSWRHYFPAPSLEISNDRWVRPVAARQDDLDDYGDFYARLYWTGYGLPANIVKEYTLLPRNQQSAKGMGEQLWDPPEDYDPVLIAWPGGQQLW